MWLLALAACGAGLSAFPFDRGVPSLQAGDPALQVQFHGVGAFSIQVGETAILTDPFWSHLSLGRVLFGKTTPDPAQVEPWLPRLDHTQMVLVGHGHYDHVLDLPLIVDRLHADATVLASRTVAHTFAPLSLPRPIVPVNAHLGSATAAGTWFPTPDGRARVMPLVSDHPAQWLFFHLYQKRLTTDRRRPPTRVGHFQEGQTLAFLIDFLDGEVITHRVYVQTSSTGLPAGAVPRSVLEERPVDVALVSMDIANLAARGDSILDPLDPSVVVFCHWEDFFRPKDRPPREIVKVDLPALHAALPDTATRRYLFPSWGATFQFPQTP